MQLSDSQLTGPLHDFMLPCLPLPSLAHLRGSCRACKQLVDEHTGAIWRSAAGSLLPLETLPIASSSQAVQARLQANAAVSRDLTSGRSILAAPGVMLGWHSKVNGYASLEHFSR